MKKIAFFILLNFIVLSIFAQQKTATISFDKTTHDFGKITQEDGFATVTFEFTNTGAESLIITNVSASCGCTTPDYTKEPVAPGKKGFVSAAYNPSNRPGVFDKSLTVTSNASNSTVVLNIKGEVTEKVKTVSDEYPNEYGSLRFDKLFVNFANIYNDETKTESMKFINVGSEKLELTINEAQIADYIKITITPASVAPNETGILTITMDASKTNDYDYIKALFYLYFNGTLNSTNRISTTAIVTERFDEATIANPPKVEFENTDFNFEPVNEGDKIEHVFTFKNTGTSDLYIRKTRASCGCTAISSSTAPIAPGQTGTINAVFNTSGKSGNQNKIITVITNDPSNSKILLKMVGTVNSKNGTESEHN